MMSKRGAVETRPLLFALIITVCPKIRDKNIDCYEERRQKCAIRATSPIFYFERRSAYVRKQIPGESN